MTHLKKIYDVKLDLNNSDVMMLNETLDRTLDRLLRRSLPMQYKTSMEVARKKHLELGFLGVFY